MAVSSGVDWSASVPVSIAPEITPTDKGVVDPGKIKGLPPAFLFVRFLFSLGDMLLVAGMIGMALAARKNAKILEERIKLNG